MEKCPDCGSYNSKGFTDCAVCGKSVREKSVAVTRRHNYVVPETVVSPPRVLNAASNTSGGEALRRAAAQAAEARAAQAAQEAREAQAVADAHDAAEAERVAREAEQNDNAALEDSGAAAERVAREAEQGLLNNSGVAVSTDTTEDGFEKTGYSKSLRAMRVEEHGDRILLPASELQPIMDNRCMDLTNSVTQEQLPVFFEIENSEWKARSVVGGLLEFTAPPGFLEKKTTKTCPKIKTVCFQEALWCLHGSCKLFMQQMEIH
jgi:hypothetical protein